MYAMSNILLKTMAGSYHITSAAWWVGPLLLTFMELSSWYVHPCVWISLVTYIWCMRKA